MLTNLKETFSDEQGAIEVVLIAYISGLLVLFALTGWNAYKGVVTLMDFASAFSTLTGGSAISYAFKRFGERYGNGTTVPPQVGQMVTS